MAAIDLCGTADVYSYLQKPVTDTSGTTVTAALITRASRLIHNWTGREFIPGAFGTAPGTAVQTVSYWYTGGQILNLAPHDLRSSPGTVQIDTETSSPTTLTENTDYYLEPLPNPLGVYEAFRFSSGYDAVTPRQVEITGTWGFASVPDDVQQACVLTVGTWLRRDVHAFSATFNVDEQRLERPASLPSAVMGMLNHYRRPGVA